MTFMSSLAANPSGSIAGQPADNNDPLALVNNIKDREMRDFQNKANFMADLSLKQDRLRALYDPSNPNQDMMGTRTLSQMRGQQGAPQPMNNTAAIDPNSPNAPGGMQRAELGIKQQQANTESQRVNQQGQMGQQAQDTRNKQEQLNQQKSDQIHEQKQNELQAKIDEASGKLTQAQAALEAKTKAGQDAVTEHEKLAKAVEDRHKVEMELMQHKFDVLQGQHQEVIDNAKQAKKDASNKTTTTTVNPEGTQKTVNTRSGAAAQNVIKTNSDSTLHVKGPDGKEYDIPADKLDHWNSTVMGSEEEAAKE